MAIAHVATEYVFTDFLLKDPPESKYKGVRLELAVDKIVTCIAVGLPLLLISLAFAQEVSVGTQISCFSPMNFSWRQAAYVDSFCWAAVQQQSLPTGGGRLPLWLHKFFPYILLLVAVFTYVPVLFWRFTAAPHLFSDLAFVMEELDRAYNRAITLAKSQATGEELSAESRSSWDLAKGCFKYPLVEQYLKTKRISRTLVVKYVTCRAVTLCVLLLASFYFGYYINLASTTDEFPCSIRTGILHNDTSLPPALQCKLVAVGVFQLLSVINLVAYLLLAPVVLYAVLVPARCSSAFLLSYSRLPTLGVLDVEGTGFDDLSLCLLFLEENLSELKSYKRMKALELLLENADEGVLDIMGLLQTLGQVRMDATDGRLQASRAKCVEQTAEQRDSGTQMKVLTETSVLLPEDGRVKENNCTDEKSLRQRAV